METNKIAELLDTVEEILPAIKDERTDENQKMAQAWKLLSHLTQVFGIVNSSNVRAPGQRLIARLVLDESNRLITEALDSIGDVPPEFNIMIDSIKSTGCENAIEKTS